MAARLAGIFICLDLILLLWAGRTFVGRVIECHIGLFLRSAFYSHRLFLFVKGNLEHYLIKFYGSFPPFNWTHSAVHVRIASFSAFINPDFLIIQSGHIRCVQIIKEVLFLKSWHCRIFRRYTVVIIRIGILLFLLITCSLFLSVTVKAWDLLLEKPLDVLVLFLINFPYILSQILCLFWP